jgi:hypothetical protein
MTKNVSLVIAETGTRWTDSVRAWRSPDNELVVLIQHHEESYQEFQCRVAERFERLRSPGVRLDQILLVAGGCQHDGCRLPRARLLHSVLADVDGRAEAARVDRIDDSVLPLRQDASVRWCRHCSGTAVPQPGPNAL